MNVLILKLGATGDVVRTTPLLSRFDAKVTWVTAAQNKVLVHGEDVRCLSWEERERALDVAYDLVINLEDELNVASFLRTTRHKKIFGAYASESDTLCYTEDSRDWFDLSIISVHGKSRADRLKFLNRRSYQELIFGSLGLEFTGENYLLPPAAETALRGDVAIAAEAGPVWPMKRWAYYGELKHRLENEGLTVNLLPKRPTLLEHLGDVANHRCLVSGDSLPMHFALGLGIRCVSIFNCTSPWEIYDYGIQMKLVSPLLEEFFYKRGYDERATAAISVDEVEAAVLAQLSTGSVANHATVK